MLTSRESVELCAQSTSRTSSERQLPITDTKATSRPRVSPLHSTSGGDAFRPRNPKNASTSVVADGFCLVSLLDQNTWVQGDPKIQLIINDKLYLFAGIRQRDIFAAGPERYLPVLDGDSVVAFAESGQRASGNLQFGLTYRERLFFFRNAEEQRKFKTHPERYVNADLVDEGNCPVSKIDDQKLISGLPETVLTLNGLRYFFASAHHRLLFMANPQRYVDSTNAAYRDLQVRAGTEREGNLNQRFATHSTHGGSATRTSQDTTSEEDLTDSEPSPYARPAVSGYCPVSIQKQGVWVRGKSRFKAAYDGKIYHMAGSDELALFRENPQEFVPVLGGDSIVAFADHAHRVPGSAYQPLIAGGRLFLFADAAEKQAFKENPALYENADLALNGNCIVSLLEEQREETGLPAYETVFQGLRYRFVSQAKLDQFLAEPERYVDQSAVAQ